MKKNLFELCPTFRNADIGLLILRFSIGLMMLLHGIAKISHGVDGIAGMLNGIGLPGWIAFGVYMGEVVAPLFMMAGFRTRLASAVFIVNMLVILFIAHGSQLFSLSPMGGWVLELQGLYFFGAVALFFTGGGKYALSSKNSWD